MLAVLKITNGNVLDYGKVFTTEEFDGVHIKKSNCQFILSQYWTEEEEKNHRKNSANKI